MTEPLLNARAFGDNAQEFLFACAFWAVAADEELTAGERAWLDLQFGPDASRERLKALSSLEGDRFFALFDQLAQALTERERRDIFPRLVPWLQACAASDHEDTAEEERVIENIRRRLRLDAAPAPEPVRAPETPPAAAPAGPEPAVRVLKGHAAGVTSVWLDRDGQTLLSASEDRTARVWSLPEGRERLAIGEQPTGLTAVLGSADARVLFAGTRGGTIAAWETAAGAWRWETAMKRHGGITALSLSGDGRRIVASSEVGRLCVLDAADGREIRSFGPRNGVTRDVRFLPDGRRALAAHDDRMARLWDLETGAEILCLKGHRDGVLAVDVRPDGRRAVSGGRDNSVRLWNLESGRELAVLTGHTFNVEGVAFSPDGRRIVSGSMDHTVCAWDADDGRLVRRHEQFGGGFTRVAVHPNGRDAAAGGSDGGIYLFRDFLA